MQFRLETTAVPTYHRIVNETGHTFGAVQKFGDTFRAILTYCGSLIGNGFHRLRGRRAAARHARRRDTS
jgi:hypothetical protein